METSVNTKELKRLINLLKSNFKEVENFVGSSFNDLHFSMCSEVLKDEDLDSFAAIINKMYSGLTILEESLSPLEKIHKQLNKRKNK